MIPQPEDIYEALSQAENQERKGDDVNIEANHDYKFNTEKPKKE